jgi:hypothetical protein
LVLETIDSGQADFGPYAALPQPSISALSDLRAVAARILADLPADELPRWVPQDLAEAHSNPGANEQLQQRALVRPGFMAPARAASAAVAVTAALRVFCQPNVQQNGVVMRELVEAIREEFWQVTTTSIDSWGRGITPVLKGVYLAALGPSLRPSDQLRHRTATSMPAVLAAGRVQINRRARKIPASLWPSWTVRLSPPDGAYNRIMAPALSSAVLLVDNRMELDEAATRLGSVTDGRSVSRLLQLLAEDPQPLPGVRAGQRIGERGRNAIGYQTPSDAAQHLGITQSTLVTQINRLERDIDGPLLERAERGRPMTATPLGEQVLAALQQYSGRASIRLETRGRLSLPRIPIRP